MHYLHRIIQSKMNQEHVLQKLQAIKQGKNQFACKLMELNQHQSHRSALQHRLFDLNSQLKQLKTKQYGLQGLKINLQCQSAQLIRTQQQYYQQIGLSKSLHLQINEQISQQEQITAKTHRNINALIDHNKCLQRKILLKKQEMDKLKKKVSQVKCNEQSARQIQQKKSQINHHLKQSISYLTNKLQQIDNRQQITQKLHSQQQNKSIDLQVKITEAEVFLKTLQRAKTSKLEQIIEEEQQIQSEMLNKKVLTQKLQILNQRLCQMQIQQVQYKKLIECKKNEVAQQRRRYNQKKKRWMGMRQRISLELEYSRYYCQKLNIV